MVQPKEIQPSWTRFDAPRDWDPSQEGSSCCTADSRPWSPSAGHRRVLAQECSPLCCMSGLPLASHVDAGMAGGMGRSRLHH